MFDHTQPTPILKNGPGRKAEESKSTRKYNAMKTDADRIVKQQEASRQFFERFSEKMTQKENKLKEKLHESWKNPSYRTNRS